MRLWRLERTNPHKFIVSTRNYLCVQWNRQLPQRLHSSVQSSSKAKQDKFPLVHRYPRDQHFLLTSFSSLDIALVHKHVRKVAAQNKPALFSHISFVIVYVLVVCQPYSTTNPCVWARPICNSATHQRAAAAATPPTDRRKCHYICKSWEPMNQNRSRASCAVPSASIGSNQAIHPLAVNAFVFLRLHKLYLLGANDLNFCQYLNCAIITELSYGGWSHCLCDSNSFKINLN